MAWKTSADSDSAESQHKSEYVRAEPNLAHIEEEPTDVKLERALKSRHITMIAIGGAIGTGLIIGTGKALASAGPASVLISYAFVGIIVWVVMCALGEMAAWLPLPSGFTGYAVRFCDPALGFALGWSYYGKYIIICPNQLTAAALVIQYWVDRDRVNPGVFILIFLVVIVCINYWGVKFFGELEFWLSSLKIVVIVALILLSVILALGGGPDHDTKGFRYWKNPGAFKAAEYTENEDTGKFLAFWSTMVAATFAYLGTELVGVTVGEAQNPRKTIPRAIKLTFYRIFVFYVVSVFFLGMLVPYNAEELAFATKAGDNASASPFVVAIQLAHIPDLPGVLNGCILLFVFSAANSDLYIATRTVYGLAREGKAPAILAKTDRRGVPIYALGLSTLFCLLAFMNVADDSKKVFSYFVNLVTIFGLLTWISLLVTHIFFIKARNAQNVPVESLAYTAPLGLWGSYFALGFCVLIALTKNFEAFISQPDKYGDFDAKTFVTGYLGIPLYLIMLFGYKFMKGTKRIPPEEADLWTGKAEIDREEEEFLARQAAVKPHMKQAGWLYRTFVSWLF